MAMNKKLNLGTKMGEGLMGELPSTRSTLTTFVAALEARVATDDYFGNRRVNTCAFIL